MVFLHTISSDYFAFHVKAISYICKRKDNNSYLVCFKKEYDIAPISIDKDNKDYLIQQMNNFY